MTMRFSAVLLVLSLVSPAVVTVVCELGCLQAHHHNTDAPSAAQCHGHQASPAPVVAVSAADWALCHDSAPVLSAIVKVSSQFASMALVIGAWSSEFRVSPARSLRSGPGFSPPNLLLITTQLRI